MKRPAAKAVVELRQIQQPEGCCSLRLKGERLLLPPFERRKALALYPFALAH